MDSSFQDNAYWALPLLSFLMPSQDSEVVLVRAPGEGRYGPERPAADLARESWEYGLLSAWAYRNDWAKDIAMMEEAEADDVKKWEAWIDEHWERWTDLPSDGLKEKANELGLYFDVYNSRSDADPKRIVIAFRGTESWRDWLSNFRWFRLTRFIPGFRDQYTVVALDLVDEFLRQLMARSLNRHDVEIVTTGHSLGGGLAQQFAYALKVPDDVSATIQPVSYVYAFHPSPVTGWYSVSKATRERNAKDLSIDRIFEHGEILAYIRLLLSKFYPPSATAPEIREIRFNFDKSRSVLKNHSMLAFALGLAKRAQTV